MKFDYYAQIEQSGRCPEISRAAPLASGLLEGCTVWSTQTNEAKGTAPRDEARRHYIESATGTELLLPPELAFDEISIDLQPRWGLIEAHFILEAPWYAKDDRPFHVLDNPVRKDRIFGVPYMPASTWKGLLRWACRMRAGLHDHLAIHGMSPKAKGEWREPDWILQLFGNEKGENEAFSRGSLAFYPTWFTRVGFEVINPHSRRTRAGTQPIYYEVVPPGTEGCLRVLYAPPLRCGEDPTASSTVALCRLLDAIENLLTAYGFSAKRTAGWGMARIIRWRAQLAGGESIEKDTAHQLAHYLDAFLRKGGIGETGA